MRTVMFSASPDAFLRIKSALELGHLRIGIYSAQEDGFILR